jgi:hypothetical protein
MVPLVLKPVYRNMDECHLADCERIAEAFADRGYECSLEMAFHLWKTHSDGMSAGWLFLPSNKADIVSRLAEYVEMN